MILVMGLLGGCGESRQPAPNCAVRPDDFGSITAPLGPGAAIPIEMLINRITIDRAGRMNWNRRHLGNRNDPTGWATLETYLKQSAMLEPVPAATIIFPRGASCAVVERARTVMRRHLACRSSGKCLQGDPSD